MLLEWDKLIAAFLVPTYYDSAHLNLFATANNHVLEFLNLCEEMVPVLCDDNARKASLGANFGASQP